MGRVQPTPRQRVQSSDFGGRRVPCLFVLQALPVEGVVLVRNVEARRRQTSSHDSHDFYEFVEARAVVSVDSY